MLFILIFVKLIPYILCNFTRNYCIYFKQIIKLNGAIRNQRGKKYATIDYKE